MILAVTSGLLAGVYPDHPTAQAAPTRRGTIKVTKALDPVTDEGRFNLTVGDTVVRAGWSCWPWRAGARPAAGPRLPLPHQIAFTNHYRKPKPRRQNPPGSARSKERSMRHSAPLLCAVRVKQMGRSQQLARRSEPDTGSSLLALDGYPTVRLPWSSSVPVPLVHSASFLVCYVDASASCLAADGTAFIEVYRTLARR